MAKVRTETINIYNPHSSGDKSEHINLKFNINVSATGVFYALLNYDDVTKLKTAGLEFDTDKKGNPGYFSSTDIDNLVYKIRLHCLEYFGREITEDSIVIKYSIETNCSYVIGKDGDICPNGSSTYMDSFEGNSWKDGTLETSATSKFPFGLKIYAKPFRKIVSKYNNGTTKSEYTRIEQNDGYYLNWLNDLVHISMPPNGLSGEIKYTEDNAKFFVDMVKWVCNTNENIKSMFSSPDKLQETIQYKMSNLLSE